MKTIQLGQESSTLYTIENKISEAKKNPFNPEWVK